MSSTYTRMRVAQRCLPGCNLHWTTVALNLQLQLPPTPHPLPTMQSNTAAPSPPPLHSLTLGTGPPILFIHGWTLSGACEALEYEPIFSKLPQNQSYQRIYADLPGMGASPAGDIKNLDDIFLRIVHFIDKHEILATSRFLVAGSSCGGYLARAVVQRYCERVDGVLLNVPMVEGDDAKRDLDANVPIFSDPAFMATIPELDREFIGAPLVQTPAYASRLQKKAEVWRPALEAADSAVLDDIRADPKRYCLSPEHLDDQARFPGPALILAGRQDEVVGWRDCLRLLEGYPRATFAVLDRETHALPVNDSGLFGSLVKNWLWRVEEWRAGRG